MKQKSFGFPIIFMIILTALFTFVLAFLNHSTAERISFNQDIELQRTILYVFDIPGYDSEPENVKEAFNKNIEEEKTDGRSIFIFKENDEVKGYAFPVEGTGLWGSVEGYAAISQDYETLLGIDFVDHSETPGLGGRISEDTYKEQFRGLDLSQVTGSDYIIYRPAAGGNVDAIAGATLTSKSVSNFLNIDIDKFIKDRKGEI